jgi:hypothetical protein
VAKGGENSASQDLEGEFPSAAEDMKQASVIFSLSFIGMNSLRFQPGQPFLVRNTDVSVRMAIFLLRISAYMLSFWHQSLFVG